LNKQTFQPDLKIHSDAGFFIDSLLYSYEKLTPELDFGDWLIYCNTVKSKYPVVTNEHRTIENYVSSYYFAEVLSEVANEKAILTTGNGCAYTSTFQAIKIKKNQRLFANVGCAAMGYDLPAAIGACIGNKRNDVICITGDGSIQMNLQEFQTIVHNQLPIKIFMFNNAGYLSIKITQENFFKGFYVGSEAASGVSIPDMLKIAEAYGVKTEKIDKNHELKDKITQVLSTEGPILCEVMLDPHEKLFPKAFSETQPDGRIISRPLEDLYPFLDREEFYENMIIKPIKI